jgi:hypothetical protein
MAEVGPTSGPTWRLSHFAELRLVDAEVRVDARVQAVVLEDVVRPAWGSVACSFQK